MLAFKGSPTPPPQPGPSLAQCSLALAFTRGVGGGRLHPALPAGEKVQVVAQLLCPVQSASLSDGLSPLWFFFSLNHCNPSVELGVFPYIERTGATAQKPQQRGTGLGCLGDSHPAQRGGLAEGQARGVSAALLVSSTLLSADGPLVRICGSDFSGWFSG